MQSFLRKRLHLCRASLFIFGRLYFVTALDDNFGVQSNDLSKCNLMSKYHFVWFLHHSTRKYFMRLQIHWTHLISFSLSLLRLGLDLEILNKWQDAGKNSFNHYDFVPCDFRTIAICIWSWITFPVAKCLAIFVA